MEHSSLDCVYKDTSNNALPITERANSLTDDIDVATPSEIIRLLRQCDSQLFSGWSKWPGLYDHETLETMKTISEEILSVLHSPENSMIVLSGCGTSGRFGFLVSQSFNEISRQQGLPPLYQYQIAGGDAALFVSVEAPEDDWLKGKEDLQKLTKEKYKVVFIGITCGLSAPYVAGQLDYCMNHPEVFTPVLLGFNPVSLARRQPIENWTNTFYDVANQLMGSSKGIVLNPVVGPEAITGSSRMKGGSMTKILLETILLNAHSRYSDASIPPSFLGTLLQYEAMYRNTYLAQDNIVKAICQAGDSLLAGGHLYYLGKGADGALGLLDASECVPTFSACYNDVRAFISGGFEMYGNREGKLSVNGCPLKISVDDFVNDLLPSVSYKDTIVVIALNLYEDDAQQILKFACEQRAKIVLIDCNDQEKVIDSSEDAWQCLKNDLKNSVRIRLPKVTTTTLSWEDGIHHSFKSYLSKFLKEISLKWVLNAISTGAHILKGKVLKNFMIDVKVSNSKLFHRAIAIICTFTSVNEVTARDCLLKAIYRVDRLTDDMKQRSVCNHVTHSNYADQVVPLAALLVTGKFTVDTALVAMRNKRVAQIVKTLLSSNTEV